MSRKKAESKQARGSDSELAEKVRELRSSLGVPQAKLAEMLQVSRSQVAEWETGGDESPSVEKLLEMARLAPITDLRRWLWIKAGVDLETIKRDFHEEVTLAIESGMTTALFQIPVVDEIELLHDAGVPLEPGKPSIGFPIEFIHHPTSTVCLRGAKRPPWVTSDDDLIIVDKAVRDVNMLVGKMAVVFVDKFPPIIGVIGVHRPAISSSWAGSKPACQTKRSRTKSEIPERTDWEIMDARDGLIVGRICVEYERERDPEVQPEYDYWRLILRLGIQSSDRQKLVLSTLQASSEITTNPPTNLEPLIAERYRIVGEVIGWIRDRRAS